MNARQPAPVIDLSSCENEPIHIPGLIQSHGALLAVEPRRHLVAWVSSNTREIFGIPAEEWLDRPLPNVFDEVSLMRLCEAIAGSSPRRVGPLPIRAGKGEFDGIVHRSGEFCILEFEPLSPGIHHPPADLFGDVQEAVERIAHAAPGDPTWQAVAEEIRRVTEFDRVMVYRFHPDDHGEVIAESRAPEMEPYLHSHYPASDIPAQARRLYQLNWLRLIVDIDEKPAALISSRALAGNQPLDLSNAVLRSVSPVHIEYLHNIGVQASMSVSLLVGGKLWGLIACHHRTPRHLPYRTRSWCELLGRILSWQIEVREWTEEATDRARATRAVTKLVQGIAPRGDVPEALMLETPSVLELVEASGAAVAWSERCVLLGQTPSEADVRALMQWLAERLNDDVFATEELSAHWPAAKAMPHLAAGLLALRVSKEHGPFVLWFRKEKVRAVNWGGNPIKPATVDPNSGKPGPRRSFAIWQETVRGKSWPWQHWEIEAARELRGPVVEAVLRHFSEVERLNSELREALAARDVFLAMASHELRTPVSTLQLQVQSLVRAAERDPGIMQNPEQLTSKLDMLRRQTVRLGRIMDEMLDAARMSAGRFDLTTDEVDLGELVREIITRDREELERQGYVPVLHLEEGVKGRWDRFRLGQVIGNLLSNATRYGVGRPVTIVVMRSANHAVLRVRDQGIGIPREAQEMIFERFQRAVSPSHYQGLGLGLWIVREIVMHMGGRIEVNSAEGQGAEFVVTLPFCGAPGCAD